MNLKERSLVRDYARSFVELVIDREEIWEIYDELVRLVEVIRHSKINALLQSATVPYADKERFVRTLRQSSHRQINNLVEDILRDGHAGLILEVLKEALYQISSGKNEFDATITSVYPLTQEQKARLCQMVEKRFHLKVRNVIEEMDKDILGGFIITVNHRVIDASVRAQLRDIRSKL